VKRIVLYEDHKSLNDATSYYINIINRAATNYGFVFLITDSINRIKFGDIIFTITINNFIKSLLLKPYCKKIFWSQGIEPEESFMRENSYFKYYAKNILEFITLRHPGLKFFVSSKMLEHYKKKYKFRGNSYIIMPCYNLNYIKSDHNNLERYNTPSFVYAGSLAKWQNIDETLLVYRDIEKKLNNSRLTLLTSEIEKAKRLIRKFNIKNAYIKYVDLKFLNIELSKHKYGFLLRKNNLVNNVATPTKMNSYLACGLIPIYTDAIDDYSKNINLNNFDLKILSKSSVKEISQRIIEFEDTYKDFKKFNAEIENVFNYYYNDEKYIEMIQTKLKNYYIA